MIEMHEKHTETHACDLISRQAAKLKVARVIWEEGNSCYDFHDKCVDCLDDVPSAQPERKTGRWITKRRLPNHIFCSECGMVGGSQASGHGPYPSNYCPFCGADMREDGEQHE